MVCESLPPTSYQLHHFALRCQLLKNITCCLNTFGYVLETHLTFHQKSLEDAIETITTILMDMEWPTQKK